MDKPREGLLGLPEELFEIIRQQGDIPDWLLADALSGEESELPSVKSFYDLVTGYVAQSEPDYILGKYAEESGSPIEAWLATHEDQLGNIGKLFDSVLFYLPELTADSPETTYKVYMLLASYCYFALKRYLEPTLEQAAALIRLTDRVLSGRSRKVLTLLCVIAQEVFAPRMGDPNFFPEFLRRFPRHKLPGIIALLSSSIADTPYGYLWSRVASLTMPWELFEFSRKRWESLPRRAQVDLIMGDGEYPEGTVTNPEALERDRDRMLVALAEAVIPLLRLVDPESQEGYVIYHSLLGTVAELGELEVSAELCDFVRETAAYFMLARGRLLELCKD